jgi:ADP-ribose pyrophosphatase
MGSARIVSRSSTVLSPWVQVVAKAVEVEPGLPPEIYHCLSQADYVAIVAVLPDGRIPIVRQFRPAVERETWEFPAGLVDAGETAQQTAVRELREETGAVARTVRDLGTYLPDTGRLENRIHVIAIEADAPAPGFVPEQGLSVDFVDPAGLRQLIRAGEFRHQMHLGALAVAALEGFPMGVLT